jgi:hypothetical protein
MFRRDLKMQPSLDEWLSDPNVLEKLEHCLALKEL